MSPGNLVTGGTGGNTTLLATIVSIDPIRFEFTFDEASYLRYERLSKTGNDIASRGAGVQVALKLIDEQDFAHEGSMDFVDNVIDRSTGTIRGRAVFANPQRHVHAGHVRARARAGLAGLYGAARSRCRDRHRAGAQIRAGGRRRERRAAEIRHARPAVDGLRVIKDGIAADDRVIVNGLMRARPGQKVTPQEQGAPPRGDRAEEY